jgi:hypothetical protein
MFDAFVIEKYCRSEPGLKAFPNARPEMISTIAAGFKSISLSLNVNCCSDAGRHWQRHKTHLQPWSGFEMVQIHSLVQIKNVFGIL